MQSKFIIVFYLILICYLSCSVSGQANKVSSKLDFDDVEDNNGSNATNAADTPGDMHGRDGGSRHRGESESGSGTGASGSGKGPKIHGVRVTVDTGNAEKSKESKESVEITDVSKHKKRVGIHTDITFEITAHGGDNETSSSSGAGHQPHGHREDASVPIFKGSYGSSGGALIKSWKYFDPPPYSAEQHSYGGGGGFADGGYKGYSEYGGSHGSSMGSSGAGDYYPQHYSPPVYKSVSMDAGSSIYHSRSSDGWSHYVPVWTTERAPIHQSELYRSRSWKPCYCMSSEYRKRRESARLRAPPLKPKSGLLQIVGSKLEPPFTKR